MKPFRYFADPMNFSYVSSTPVKCRLCSKVDFCFTESAFYGQDKGDFICDECVVSGKAKEHGMSGNEPSDVDIKLLSGDPSEITQKIEELVYKTPKLPSWQDIWWPVLNGDFCTFIKIASKCDFVDQNELFSCIRAEDLYGHTADDFWEMLADGPITNLKNGNYNVSFYLFQSKDQKIVLWDCN